MHQDFDPRDLEPMPPSREKRGRGLPFSLPKLPGGMAPIAVAATAIIGFGGIVWWALGQGDKTADSGGAPPVIKADESASRRKPDNPGGLVVPNQDKFVLNQSGANPQAVERLLPGPEAPMPKTALPPPAPSNQLTPGMAAAGVVAGVAAGTVVAAPPPPVASGAAPASTVQPQPRAVSTQTAVAPPPRPAAAAPIGAPAAVQAPALAASGFRVQLAAVRNAEVAATEWSRMQKNHPELAPLRMTAVPVEIDGRAPFVRLQAGPFPSLDAAQKICADLKARNQGCLVVRP
jgi:hypothetical protein